MFGLWKRAQPRVTTSTDGEGREFLTEGPDSEVRVQLRYATLPRPLHTIAIHYWFVIFEGDQVERWEVWQDPDRGGTSWAHLHRDLMHPDRPVGGGPMFREREWRGDEARALAAVLRAPERYPFQGRYLAWPGPNSNTYVEWALAQAGLEHRLDPRAIGRDYLGRFGFGIRRTPRFWQVGCPLFGLKVGGECFELHLLCLSFGVAGDELVTPCGCRPLPGRREVRTPASDGLSG